MFDKEIITHYGTYKVHPSSGWTGEVNLVSWDGRKPKVEMREWDPNHDKCSKGITFTDDELNTVYEILKGMFEEEIDEGTDYGKEDVLNHSEDSDADRESSGVEG